MSLNGIEKSAILLMSISIDSAVEILKSFTALEVKKILKCMININTLSAMEVNQVLKECVDFVHPINYFSYLYGDYVLLILKKVLGKKDASIFLEENVELKDIHNHIKKLNSVDSNQLFRLIEHEHNQIITAILIYIKDEKAAQILSFFTEKKRSEIMFRIATFTGLEKFGKIALEKIVNNILSRYENNLNNKISIKKAADILGVMKKKDKKLIIDDLFNNNQELTKKILNEVFSFKHLIKVKDKFFYLLINDLKLDTICIALHNADELLKNKFIKNMSERDADYLRTKLSEKNIVSITDITHAQMLILKTMRSLLSKEEIIIKENEVK